MRLGLFGLGLLVCYCHDLRILVPVLLKTAWLGPFYSYYLFTVLLRRNSYL